jgi:hypothetical protein
MTGNFGARSAAQRGASFDPKHGLIGKIELNRSGSPSAIVNEHQSAEAATRLVDPHHQFLIELFRWRVPFAPCRSCGEPRCISSLWKAGITIKHNFGFY